MSSSHQTLQNQHSSQLIPQASGLTSSLTGQKIVPNNCKNDFDYFLRLYCQHVNDKGDVYTWGSGEMGQLGYSSRTIQVMPKDREGYPFQPNPLEIE
jgi:hypothetical protein